jgi:hypothetical protein
MERSLRADKFASDFDVIVLGRLRAEVGAHPAIDRDLARSDQLIAMPARSDTGGSEKTV